MEIASVYSSFNGKVDDSVLYTLVNLDVRMWIACLTCLLMNFVILLIDLNLTRRFVYMNRKKRMSLIWKELNRIIVHFICQGTIVKKRKVTRLMFFTTSMLTFISIVYFDTSIKTELVTIDEPRLIRTYDDIIRYKVTPLWINNFDHFRKFQKASPTSSEWKLWNYAKNNFKNADILATASAQTFGEKLTLAMEGKIAMITSQTIISMIIKSACKRKSRSLAWVSVYANTSTAKLEAMNSFRSSDPSAHFVLQSVLYNQFTKENKPMKHLKKRITTMFEWGFIEWIHEQFNSFDLIDSNIDMHLGPIIEEKRSLAYQCEKWTPNDGSDHDRLSNLRTYSFRHLFYLCFSLICFAFVLIFLERKRFPRKIKPSL